MLEFAIASIISNSQAHAIQTNEDVNKVCSYIVGIPYASDDFNDSEWKRFELCRKLISES